MVSHVQKIVGLNPSTGYLEDIFTFILCSVYFKRPKNNWEKKRYIFKRIINFVYFKNGTSPSSIWSQIYLVHQKIIWQLTWLKRCLDQTMQWIGSEGVFRIVQPKGMWRLANLLTLSSTVCKWKWKNNIVLGAIAPNIWCDILSIFLVNIHQEF